jgi:Tol biopolymer transport system component
MLVALVALGALAVGVAGRRATTPPRRFAWIADAHQYGPVGYRDPAGAISPDGSLIGYSEGRFLRVRPVGGGPIVELPPGDTQIRNLAWTSDSRHIVTDGDSVPGGWVVYDVAGTRRRLWADRPTVEGSIAPSNAKVSATVPSLRQLAWSPAGHSVAAIVNGTRGAQLWTIQDDGSTASTIEIDSGGAIGFPAWTSTGRLACVTTRDGRPRVTIPCGGAPISTDPPLDIYGPIGFAPDRDLVYASAPNASGTLDLWSFASAGGRATQLTSFSRDTYAPSVTRDGRIVFKVQSYRTVVAIVDAGGGVTRPLATFQSETPSWDPTGQLLGITYGTWRRVIDDAKYPDIAQDAGIIGLGDMPAARVSKVAQASPSEDQALCWSPNRRWIAFHSHKDQSDDIWLRPADGDNPEARRISFLGRGAETGWPRWSPDGRWILFSGSRRDTHRSSLFVVGVDQESGRLTADPRPIELTNFPAEVGHAEWLPDSAHVVAVAKEGPGRQLIATFAAAGGDAHVVHRFESEHDTPGIGVAPDGRDIAFIAPAADGFFQVFRTPIGGGTPLQVTRDRSNKTQPAWSPDGARIAFTVWSYDAQFWRLE